MDDDAIYAMSLDDLREFAIKTRDELEEARSGWLNEKTERQGCEARLKEAEKNWHAAERESEAIYTVAWTLYKALDGLIHATKNPGDGGPFEAGELPELDAARQAVAEFQSLIRPGPLTPSDEQEAPMQIKTPRELLDRLVTQGGGIVRSSDCSEMEIADAQARGDFYVDDAGLGYVVRLKQWFDLKYEQERAAPINPK